MAKIRQLVKDDVVQQRCQKTVATLLKKSGIVLEDVPMGYVVEARRGQAWVSRRYFTVPMWAYDRRHRNSPSQSLLGEEGYFVYYVAHELAHIISGSAYHKVEFYQAFLKLCPVKYQRFEIDYKKSAARFGVPCE